MNASITAAELKSSLAGAQPPLLVDVRRTPAFRSAPDMAAGALRRDPATVSSWAKELPRAGSVVVYCVHGHEVSQNAAKAKEAIPYDVPNVHFSHDGELCSFDAFLKTYRLTGDTALAQLAVIVRGADTARLDLAPQSAGLLAVSLGLSRNFKDDHEMLKHGMVMYDALYAWCREGQDETHTWNPAAYR